ncbi:polysaccharide deacetylase family protein [Victivallis vadensis]|uniref:Polysaccharide deacetylase family protein n=1 Tax=Victivallis vadensis TaxID=172901 RepID=A0A848AVJ4_9BACT|nr:polysaccharide deacetylase family protein [Victivallis vadensis]NMD86323.1 polysaccharide deacetylase family protein [Victivallis vadensis]PWM76110.1 MAG: polysaccharide deacetylase [Lentisphaerota bacterium]HJH02771.1 polysaccharide deacetylase family protein [Victivallis vadensis]
MFGKTVILTFDDAVSNHAQFVAPLLRELGFSATFFICEFPPDFATDKRQYMTWEQIRQLHELGFELGNHTLNHTGVTGMTETAFAAEFDALERKLIENGIPRSRSFAYPGGPGSAHVHAALRARDVRFARIVEERPWRPAVDDSYMIPAYAVHGDGEAFHRALAAGCSDAVPVLVYHGIPDYAHPWVDTAPEKFAEEMRFLASEGYRALSFSDFADSAFF